MCEVEEQRRELEAEWGAPEVAEDELDEWDEAEMNRWDDDDWGDGCEAARVSEEPGWGAGRVDSDARCADDDQGVDGWPGGEDGCVVEGEADPGCATGEDDKDARFAGGELGGAHEAWEGEWLDSEDECGPDGGGGPDWGGGDDDRDARCARDDRGEADEAWEEDWPDSEDGCAPGGEDGPGWGVGAGDVGARFAGGDLSGGRGRRGEKRGGGEVEAVEAASGRREVRRQGGNKRACGPIGATPRGVAPLTSEEQDGQAGRVTRWRMGGNRSEGRQGKW